MAGPRTKCDSSDNATTASSAYRGLTRSTAEFRRIDRIAGLTTELRLLLLLLVRIVIVVVVVF